MDTGSGEQKKVRGTERESGLISSSTSVPAYFDIVSLTSETFFGAQLFFSRFEGQTVFFFWAKILAKLALFVGSHSFLWLWLSSLSLWIHSLFANAMDN